MSRFEIQIRENGTKRVISHFDGPSLTRQEFKDECDLEKIIARFSSTPDGLAQLEAARGYLESRFEDVSSVPDYREALDQVRAADAAFNGLPAELRSRFENDPARFIDFALDPNNLPELRKLGLANPEQPKEVEAQKPPGV